MESNATFGFWETFPGDILEEIFWWLDEVEDYASLSCVCIKWRTLCQKNLNPIITSTRMLRFFCKKGDVNMVRGLLKDPSVDPIHTRGCALLEASMGCHEAVVDMLLSDPRVKSLTDTAKMRFDSLTRDSFQSYYYKSIDNVYDYEEYNDGLRKFSVKFVWQNITNMATSKVDLEGYQGVWKERPTTDKPRPPNGSPKRKRREFEVRPVRSFLPRTEDLVRPG